MEAEWKSVLPEEVEENIFSLIGQEWMLITAGKSDSFNTMTASWGGFGVLWRRNVSFCFVRPNRHSYDYMNQSDYFTLSFFPPAYRRVLTYCGEYSGHDVDKVKETGITPFDPGHGTVAFKEAKIIVVCRKLYYQDFNSSNFLVEGIEDLYPDKQYHRMYIGEICECRMRTVDG